MSNAAPLSTPRHHSANIVAEGVALQRRALRKRRIHHIKQLIGRLEYDSEVAEQLATKWNRSRETINDMAAIAYDMVAADVTDPLTVKVNVGVAATTGLRKATRREQWGNVDRMGNLLLKVAGLTQQGPQVNLQQNFQVVGEQPLGTRLRIPAMKAMFSGYGGVARTETIDAEAVEPETDDE
jgi:hypothetical protein